VTLRIGACLSLTGKFGQFGQQAAHGLAAWRSMGAPVDLVIEDDRSDRGTIEATLPRLAKRCDLLLGPYSTALMRTAGKLAPGSRDLGANACQSVRGAFPAPDRWGRGGSGHRPRCG
jgi:hypothetical protein